MNKANYFTFLAAIAALALDACTPPPIPAQPPVQRAQHAALEQAATAPVTCTAGADCTEKWNRAQNWVKKNSSYSIRTVSDRLIETYGPIEPTTDSAFTVTLTASPQGNATIGFNSSCGKTSPCVPSALDLKASFNRYVMWGY